MRRCYFIALIAGPIFFATLVSCQVAKSSHQHSEIPAQTSSSQTANYTRLGGLIYIHGHGARSDWTGGCVALENEDIKELFDAVAVGTPVTILS